MTGKTEFLGIRTPKPHVNFDSLSFFIEKTRQNTQFFHAQALTKKIYFLTFRYQL